MAVLDILKRAPVVRSVPRGAKPEIDARLARWTWLLEESFRLPGTSKRIGLDGLLGLVPGGGDAATLAMAFLMLREAQRLGLPKGKQALLIGNYVIDFVGGLIPFAGDIFDFAFKANKKNLQVLQKHVDQMNRR
jgi:hypothetical protein